MKNFNKLSMVLFDSTNASFKLSVEANFTKTNPTGGFSPLVYVSNNGTANLNPNIYLLFQFKSETYDKGNSLYMSYPQLFRVREALESIKALVATGAGYTSVPDGGAEKLVVKQEYAEPVVLTNIGKQNKWLSLKLVIMSQVEEGITKYQPGVSIEISSANGYASVLSVEEFLTVYTIVHDLNLSALQAQFSLAFLSADEYQPQPQMGYGYPQQNPYGGQQRNAGVYQQPRQQNQGYPAPRYNNYQGQPQQRPAPVGRQVNTLDPAQQMPQPTVTFQGAAQPATYTTNINNALPPRTDNSQNLMNFSAINNTPAEEMEINFNDDSAIDDIFKED